MTKFNISYTLLLEPKQREARNMGFFDKKRGFGRRGKNSRFLSDPKWEVRARKDKELKNRLEALADFGDDLENFDGKMKTALEMNPTGARRVVGKLINTFLPERFHSVLPEGLMLAAGEEGDILMYLGTECRSNVNNIQEAVIGVIDCAKETYEEYQKLGEDLADAEKNNWDAQELLRYIAEETEIEIDPRVMELLDRQFGLLSDEEKEKEGKAFLDELKNVLAMKKVNIQGLSPVCIASLHTLRKGIIGLYNFESVVKPHMTIKKAAEQLVKTNATLFDARDMLEGTIRTSMGAIRAVLEAGKSGEKYSIVSEDMQHIMIEEARKLEKQLKSVGIEDKSARRKALTDERSPGERAVSLEEGLFSDSVNDHTSQEKTDEKTETM
ncbi:MAG: hypothetical protein HYZ69_03295 [Candidatus Colwellbacteria bacterium]|nr:hypothetical protein [Candidatus Colwellbacteria bacterium]